MCLSTIVLAPLEAHHSHLYPCDRSSICLFFTIGCPFFTITYGLQAKQNVLHFILGKRTFINYTKLLVYLQRRPPSEEM